MGDKATHSDTTLPEPFRSDPSSQTGTTWSDGNPTIDLLRHRALIAVLPGRVAQAKALAERAPLMKMRSSSFGGGARRERP